jgi:peptidoglycan hydrolase-like protein with peptidoglycan-binding domain
LSFLPRNSKVGTLVLAVSMVWVLSVCALAAPSSHTSPVAKKSSANRTPAKKTTRKARTSRSSRSSWRRRGQHGMDASRVREIQQALIRQNYLNGSADGVWGPTSQAAMARYQADNGWQAKVVPDSRALIKLGLGPDRSSVINPESLQSSLVPQPRGAQD